MALEPKRSMQVQIADLVRQGLTDGTYPPGSQFPSEHDLAAQFSASRSNVNLALQDIRAEGWLRLSPGNPTVVRIFTPANRIPRSAIARYAEDAREHDGGKGAFDASIRALGYTPKVVADRSEVNAPEAVAAVLGESRVYRRNRLMYAGDEPVQIAPSYIPLDVAALSLTAGPNQGQPLMAEDSGIGGIISRYADLGVPQVRITERIITRRASQEEMEFLQLDVRQQVTEITHTGWTADKRPVEVCVHVVSPSAWALDYEFPLG